MFKRNVLNIGITIILLFLIFMLSGCWRIDSNIGSANVTEIEIYTLESFPVQIQVIAKGYLPNPCSKIIHPITVEREGNNFLVTIKTKSSQGVCIQLLAPFKEKIPLDVYGLPAGTYTVDVNGIKGTFTLDIDNILPPENEKM